MRRVLRPFVGALAGAVCLFLVGLDALLLGLVPLHSPLVTLLPVVGIGLGALWAWWAPIRPRARGQ